MTLQADVRASRGAFTLNAVVEASAGEVVAVLGRNGAGKSTLLDCLAGLLRPPGTSVVLDGRELSSLPPHRRHVGVLRQRPLLFPHLSALDNVAFGPRSAGASRAAARETAREWLSAVDAADLAGHRPARLSGGQAQRVALARALATEPALLLLDEPLAALDADSAPAIRSLLRRILRDGACSERPVARNQRSERAVGCTRPAAAPATILVTHDPLDAMALADKVLVLADGEVVERGPTQQVLSAPRTPFAARLAGLNLIAGTTVPGGLRTAGGAVLHGVPADGTQDGPAVAVFPPSAVSVYPPGHEAGHGSPRNTAPAVIAALEPHGSVVRLRTEPAEDAGWAAGIAADITPAAVAELDLRPRLPITVEVKATAVRIHPA